MVYTSSTKEHVMRIPAISRISDRIAERVGGSFKRCALARRLSVDLTRELRCSITLWE